ncbi:hypothetical protein AAKU58_004232 [Oxalobacteraceae bacterium GrIS 1.18]
MQTNPSFNLATVSLGDAMTGAIEIAGKYWPLDALRVGAD